ncbi:T9SS type A sorting domain-containing protein [Pedobacter sp. SD-b]|uniref:T9SS type A sorting domain-containing protein n=1 Tax=Pedobacter segetis TaxID=2793069 RepID=A0ABS1BGQ0_9SPHI|nr:T9SS type A sorting domain-containing protein [Pedobacter segetis]MBK0382022.1 T9SS type A sorting domain-containing protein [Pedobacter segetis]
MNSNILLKRALIFLFLITTKLTFAQTNYYVSTTGDDLNSGLTGSPKATIQSAIAVASDNDIINIEAGTYDGLVIVNKQLKLIGADKSNTIIKFTGTVSGGVTPSLFKITALNVTVSKLGFETDLSKLWSAIITSGDASGLRIENCGITATKSAAAYAATSYTDRNAINANTIGRAVDGVAVLANPAPGFIYVYDTTIEGTVGGGFGNAFFRAGVSSDGYALYMTNNTIQTISHDVISRFQTSPNKTSLLTNSFNGGGIEFAEPNAGFLGADIENNSFNWGLGGTPNYALVRLKNNNANKPFLFKSNLVENNYWLMSLENFQNITAEGNIFNPVVDANNTFKSVTINTKTLASSSNTKLPISATFIGNTFNGVSGSVGSKALAFYNHDSNSAAFGTFILGTAAQKNTFNQDIANYIYIDDNNGNQTQTAGTGIAGFPEYGEFAATTTAYWATNIRADQNNFYVDGQLRAATSLDATQRTELDGKIYDKLDNTNIGSVQYYFPVQDVTSGLNFATIQEAIDDASTVNGDIINVNPGTYTLTSTIQINKEITLRGNNNTLATKPLINGVGDATRKSLINVSAKNVTIQNFEMQFDESVTNSESAINTTANGTFDNLSILDNKIEGTSASYKFGKAAIFLGLQTNPTAASDKVTVKRNTVDHTVSGNAMSRGIRSWFINGTIGGSVADKNTIKAFYSSMELAVSGGSNDLNVSYNDVIGKIKIGGLKPGNHSVSNNMISSGGTATAALAGGPGATAADIQASLFEVVGSKTSNANLTISNNTFTDFKYAGVSLLASSNVSILNNTFNPLANETGFGHIIFDTKTSDTQAEAAKTYQNITIKGNLFNGSGVAGGTGLGFANSNGSSTLSPLSNIIVGGANTEANTFSSSLTTLVNLVNETRTSDQIPFWTSQAYAGTATTTAFPFSTNVDLSANNIDADLISGMTDVDLYALETKINHGIDADVLGFVTLKPSFAYPATAPETLNAVKVAPEDYTLLVKAGVDLSATTILATKSLTLSSQDATLTFGSLGINAASKALTLDKPTTTNALVLTAGKVVSTATNTLTVPATGISFTSGIGNFVDGPLNVTGINADMVIPIGKGTKAAYIGLTNVASGASDFTAEYFQTAYSNTTNKETSIDQVLNKEYWLLNRTSGALSAKVSLYSFDLIASGLAGTTDQQGLVAWFNGTQWVNQGNASNNSLSITANLGNSSFSPFTFGMPVLPLPVDLISFKADLKTNGVLLTWATAAERDNDHFEIEKSDDGVSFLKIANVNGAGQSSHKLNYQFSDASFYNSAYYRLVQIDKNGKKTVYNDLVRFVKGLNGSLTLSVYPNPTTQGLFIKYNSNNPDLITGKLIDGLGRTVLNFKGSSQQSTYLDLNTQKAGPYILQIKTPEGIQIKKIIKQ